MFLDVYYGYLTVFFRDSVLYCQSYFLGSSMSPLNVDILPLYIAIEFEFPHL